VSKTDNKTKGLAASGGGRPIMRSVNILMTQDIEDKVEQINPVSRSAAVRDISTVILNAYAAENTWVVGTIQENIELSTPRKRREDLKNGVIWNKAIVWIPENMYREIDRIGKPNGIKVSEFLRGAVMYATGFAKTV
jgi:metal-responsive CopG/Arc/MetJ family transcriptional regulator